MSILDILLLLLLKSVEAVVGSVETNDWEPALSAPRAQRCTSGSGVQVGRPVTSGDVDWVIHLNVECCSQETGK